MSDFTITTFAFFGMIALYVILNLRNLLRKKTKLREIASTLGFEYRDIRSKKSIHGDLADVKPSRIKLFLEKADHLTSPWEMKGFINGMRVTIFPQRHRTDDTKSLFTRIEIELPEKLDLGLKIFSENFLMNKLEDSTNLEKVQSGNKIFDEKIKVRGKAEEKIRMLLNRREVQDALLKLLELEPTAVVDDKYTYTEELGVVSDAKRCRKQAEALTEVAQCIYRAQRSL